GFSHLQRAQRASTLTRWHLMAGIAAEHATAPTYEQTDWATIASWYEQLVALDPSAAPRLGHAIALAEGGTAAEALRRLQALLPQAPAALQAHTWAALARAHERLDQIEQAVCSLDRAIACARHAADGRLLQRRRDTLAVRLHTS
ncbi:MAG: hypothetical protein ACKVQR_24780, partial [Aquabacterium sp.]